MKEMKILQTMNMVDEEYLEEMNEVKGQSRRGKRKITTLVVIAALVAVMGVGVFAKEYRSVVEDWFYWFFAANNQPEVMENLSENQQEVMESLSVNQQEVFNEGFVAINQSMTLDGWTVTLESGISDGYRLLVKYRVDAPEGVVLDSRYSLDFWPVIKTAEGKTIDWNGPTIAQWTIPDEDPEDNSMTRLIDCTGGSTSEGKPIYVPDGAVVHMEVRNIWKTTGHAQAITWERVWEKDQKFEVELGQAYMAKDTIEITEETYCAAKRRYKDVEFDFKLKVMSAEVRALTAMIKFEIPQTGFGDGIFIDSIRVVLNDGTAIESQGMCMTNYVDHLECTVEFDQPVPIKDVAYIDFP